MSKEKDMKEKTVVETIPEKKRNSIYDLIEAEIRESESSLDEKNKKLSRLAKIKNMKLNVMLIGATGVGKSSTINALFDMSVAKVGSIEPETTTIQKYELENVILFYTPGFGDSTNNDKAYMNLIKAKLSEQDNKHQHIKQKKWQILHILADKRSMDAKRKAQESQPG